MSKGPILRPWEVQRVQNMKRFMGHPPALNGGLELLAPEDRIPVETPDLRQALGLLGSGSTYSIPQLGFTEQRPPTRPYGDYVHVSIALFEVPQTGLVYISGDGKLLPKDEEVPLVSGMPSDPNGWKDSHLTMLARVDDVGPGLRSKAYLGRLVAMNCKPGDWVTVHIAETETIPSAPLWHRRVRNSNLRGSWDPKAVRDTLRRASFAADARSVTTDRWAPRWNRRQRVTSRIKSILSLGRQRVTSRIKSILSLGR